MALGMEVDPPKAFFHRYMQASAFRQSAAAGMRNQSEWNTSLRLSKLTTCMAKGIPASEGKGCWGMTVPRIHRKAIQSSSPTVSRNDARFFKRLIFQDISMPFLRSMHPLYVLFVFDSILLKMR
jgi:hypothetical protein